MSFVLLHADRLRSVAASDALVRARDVDSVRDAAALLVEAGRLRDSAEQDIAAAREAAHEAGREEGRALGRAAAAEAMTEALARIEAAAAEREAKRQGDVARLALEVVRRMAGDLGDAALVAGLAERAAASVTAEAGAIVRVAPGVADAVRDRLRARAELTVEGDAALSPHDLVLETPLGRTHAGLETQLAAIERAWAAI
jgi:flagellar biosynthesis/type III secretory pathway protein FliH